MNYVRSLLVAFCLVFSTPAWAANVTLIDTDLRVQASDDGLSGQVSTLNPGTLPFMDSDTIQEGANTASSTYDLSNSGFSITFDHTRQAGSEFAFALSFGVIRFSVDADVDYVLSGSYAAMDAEGREISFDSQLRENGSILAESSQDSLATVNESFVLGGSGGDIFNSNAGSLTGTLTAGNVYSFQYQSLIRAFPTAASQSASATGSITLALIPEPSAGLLLAGGLLALGLRRRQRSQ